MLPQCYFTTTCVEDCFTAAGGVGARCNGLVEGGGGRRGREGDSFTPALRPITWAFNRPLGVNNHTQQLRKAAYPPPPPSPPPHPPPPPPHPIRSPSITNYRTTVHHWHSTVDQKSERPDNSLD